MAHLNLHLYPLLMNELGGNRPYARRAWLRGAAGALVGVALAGCEGVTVDFSPDTTFDTTSDASDTSDDAETADTRPVEPDVDYAGYEQIGVRWDGEGFWDRPWPSDLRLRPDRTPSLDGFPNATVPLLVAYRAQIEGVIQGYSLNPVISIGLDADPGITTWPTPDETVAADSHVQLVRLTGGCGERVPVELSWDAVGDRYAAANTLRAAPVPGFSLAPATTYAFVILRSLGNDDGVTITPPADLAAILDGTSDTQSRPHPSWAALTYCLDNAGLFRSQIAAVTVFTTQDPVTQTRQMRDFVMDSANVRTPEIVSWSRAEARSNEQWETWVGTYRTPIFQSGSTPYAAVADGGAFVFDDVGAPVVQRFEDVPFTLSWPKNGTAPYPVMVWSDGTGASTFSHIGDVTHREALARGFAVANFQPQFHANRSGEGADETLHTFNYLNPASGRSVFRQQVIDTSYFIRVIREQMQALEAVPQLDTDRLVYGGHSQGALVGALLAAVETEFRGYFLNGVGGLLSITIVERKDPFDIAQLISSLLRIGRPLDRFHPVVQLAQLGADVVDPAAYASQWTGWDAHPDGNHVFTVNGDVDSTTHIHSINALTIAGDLAPVAPQGWTPDPFGVWNRSQEATPVQGNRVAMSGRDLTLATLLVAGSGHFTIYRQAAPMRMGADFWLTAAEGTPVVDRQ